MHRTLRHAANEARLRLALARRYWFESLLGLVLVCLLFAGLLSAVLTVSNSGLQSGRLDGLFIGFALWLFANTAYSSGSHDIADETRARTLEQMCVAPISLWMLLAIRSTIRLLGGLAFLAFSFWAIEIISSNRLSLLNAQVFLLAILAAPSLVGLGFMMAGIILLAKKADAAHALTYPALIAVVALPAYPVNVFSLLPYALGAAAARAAGAGEAVPIEVMFLVGAVSALWLSAGVLVFVRLEKLARGRGLLGHF